MIKGIAFVLTACFIWGQIFIIPQFMDGFSAMEVAIGRYFFYGLISVLLLFKLLYQRKARISAAFWYKAFSYGLIANFCYYPFVILGLRYSTPAICALILGLGPITIAFYGNWKEKECSFKSLIFPTILILIGLILINYPHLSASDDPSEYLLGLLCCGVALMTWTWYVVANARLLKDHPEMPSDVWSTLLGVGTLFWVFAISIPLILFSGNELELEKFYTAGPALTQFLVGSACLGIFCSWVGGYLWNQASYYLPVSLAGQLSIFETIFALCFVCALDQCLPPTMEWVAIILFLSAIVYGIRTSAKALPQTVSEH